MPDAFQQLTDALFAAKKVLVTTHVRPDGDALGSSAGMVLGLRERGVAADVLLLSHLPRKYAFIYHDAGVNHVDVETGFPSDFSLDGYEALLVVDTGTWSQLPGLREHVEQFGGKKLIVDHHLTQEDWADVLLVDTSAGACCEITYDVLRRWQVPMTAPLAQALFVGIVADTGWLTYSNTRPVTLRTAASLMEAGVNTDRVYQLLYQNERPERVALHARGLASMELAADGRLAVMTIRRQDFADTHSHVNDTENLINFPLQIRTVEASILLVEPPDPGPIRVSLRSKGGVDVAAFAKQFGGGGHARAAGLKLDGDLAVIRQRLIGAMGRTLSSAGPA